MVAVRDKIQTKKGFCAGLLALRVFGLFFDSKMRTRRELSAALGVCFWCLWNQYAPNGELICKVGKNFCRVFSVVCGENGRGGACGVGEVEVGGGHFWRHRRFPGSILTARPSIDWFWRIRTLKPSHDTPLRSRFSAPVY